MPVVKRVSIFLFSVILFILLVFLGYLFYFKNQIDSTDERVIKDVRPASVIVIPTPEVAKSEYTSYKYKDLFSIDFPNNWNVFNMKEMQGDWGDNVFFASPEITSIPEGRSFSAFRLLFKQNSNIFTFSKFKEYIESSEGLNVEDLLYTDLSSGNIKKYQAETPVSADPQKYYMKFATTYIYGPNNLLIITSMEKEVSSMVEYRKIIDSIKFL